MGKLYVFGIGGTGSRVLKSLTMLLAAGVKINADEIVPVIIDPDHASADLARTVKLLRNYNNAHHESRSVDDGSGFFSTKINLEILPSAMLPVKDAENAAFKEYIGLEGIKNISRSSFALASMLFSEEKLNAGMDTGLKGGSSIGSVVLNQISASPEFKNLLASFGQNDRIFIISSTFGGTGTVGFPLLIKSLRDIKEDAGDYLKNAIIGAVLVLPYFCAALDEESENGDSDFISKTKAALSYYDRNINEANALYYISDSISNQYGNSERGPVQHNKAHFIELAAALAIVDFAGMTDLATQNGKPERTCYREFGVKREAECLSFGNLGEATNLIIKKPLTQFLLFCKYMDERLVDSYPGQSWAKKHNIDDVFVKNPYFQSDLSNVKNGYISWLTEMANNSRAFEPFDLQKPKDRLFELIKDEIPTLDTGWFKKNNYELFDATLNKLQVKGDHSKPFRNFVELFFQATEKLVNLKFGM